jgi:hypothetical protein
MKLKELLSEIKLVQADIGCSEPYICGGAPRDKYLDRLDNLSDLDITTGDKSIDYLSEELYKRLSKKYNVFRKIMNDGHSSIYLGNIKIDFSSNFNSPNIDNILAKMGITNPTEMQKEIFSRDFTCNSLLLPFTLDKIIDPTKRGFEDINNKIIKTCLSPEITLIANKNRVIRAIYLACKLNFNIDPSIIEYVKNNPNSVKISTVKSLSEKLNESFKYDSEKASKYLTEMGLWNYIPITDLVYPYYMKHVKEETNVTK